MTEVEEVVKSDEWFAKGSKESDEVIEYYNNWADEYEESVRSWDYQSPEQAVELLQKYNQKKGTICDAGCGSGLTGEALKDGGFDSIVGFDLSPDFAKVAIEKNIYDDVHILNMHERPFRFADNEFANLICIGVLTYVENVPAVVREFARIVEPGGMVIFSHRTDMIDDPDYQKGIKALEEDGVLKKEYISNPLPYLPGNEEFGEDVQLVFYSYRVV